MEDKITIKLTDIHTNNLGTFGSIEVTKPYQMPLVRLSDLPINAARQKFDMIQKTILRMV